MTNKIYENLNLITPLKITSTDGVNEFFATLNTFYSKLEKPYPVHLIKDDSDFKIKNEIKNRCKQISENIIFIEENRKTNMTEAVEILVDKTDKKYLFLMLADVILLENFFDPTIDFMEKDNKLLEVCVGGSFFHRGKSNKEFLKKIDNKIFIDRDLIADKNSIPNLIGLEPYLLENNTIWTSYMKCGLFYNFHYLMAMWNCIIRTECCKKIFKDIRNFYNPNSPALDNFTKRVCVNDEISRLNYPPNLKEEWNEEFEWMEQYKVGFLNICPYIYPNGRGDISLENFLSSYRNKIKTKGDV